MNCLRRHTCGAACSATAHARHTRDSPRLALGPASGDPAPPLPPPHLRQEIVLGKYDEGKQQFEARYTHSLADVKQAMMRTQVHPVYLLYWCKSTSTDAAACSTSSSGT